MLTRFENICGLIAACMGGGQDYNCGGVVASRFGYVVTA